MDALASPSISAEEARRIVAGLLEAARNSTPVVRAQVVALRARGISQVTACGLIALCIEAAEREGLADEVVERLCDVGDDAWGWCSGGSAIWEGLSVSTEDFETEKVRLDRLLSGEARG